MAKKQATGYPLEFRKMAVERLKSCDNVVALGRGTRRASAACCTSGATNWSRSMTGEAPPENIRERDLRIQSGDGRSGCWPRRRWRWIFSKVPCKKSRLDARADATWRDGIYDQIRELMSMQGKLSIERMCQIGGGQPGGLLSVAAGTSAGRRRHGSAVGDPEDLRRA